MVPYEVSLLEVPQSYVKWKLRTPGHFPWTPEHEQAWIVVQQARRV
jgi:hypothetical protein